MKKYIKYFLSILFITAIIVPWGYIFDVQNESLRENIGIAQRSAGLIILTPIIVAIIYKVFRIKTFKQELEDMANKVDKEREQPLGPSRGQILFFLFLLFIGAFNLFLPERPGEEWFKLAIIGIMIFFAWMWYKLPVFTFTKEYLQIEPSFSRFFHIDIKRIVRYGDMLSVKMERIPKSPYEVYALFITTKQEGRKRYVLFFNDDITAKIYWQLKERVGDRINTLFRKN